MTTLKWCSTCDGALQEDGSCGWCAAREQRRQQREADERKTAAIRKALAGLPPACITEARCRLDAYGRPSWRDILVASGVGEPVTVEVDGFTLHFRRGIDGESGRYSGRWQCQDVARLPDGIAGYEERR